MSNTEENTRRIAHIEPDFLHGILQWPQLDTLWAQVRKEPAGWYAAVQGHPVPDRPLDAPELLRLVDDIDATLRREHRQTYCGIVYADHPEAPGYIRVFDPRTLGSFCSCSSEPTPPRWVLSRRRPEPADDATRPASRTVPWWRRWLPGSRRWGVAR